MPEQLSETISDWHDSITIERESLAIRNVALSGLKSRNGYRYRPSALQAAAQLYERVPVFLDHPERVQQPKARSTRDLAGRVRGVRYDGARLRGDLELFDTEAGRTLLALAESDGPGVGMSHVVLAERSEDGATVERIVEVISVDAVAFPATTTTFHENQTSPQRKQGNQFHTNPKRQSQIGRGGRGNENSAADRSPSERHLAGAAGAAGATSESPLPGSLERLLAEIDVLLPDHLARLSRRGRLPAGGRAARVALFPRELVLEWRVPGRESQRLSLDWRLDRAGVRLGTRLAAADRLSEGERSWRGRLGRAAAPPEPAHVTSRRRRATASPRVDDEMFVRTITRQ